MDYRGFLGATLMGLSVAAFSAQTQMKPVVEPIKMSVCLAEKLPNTYQVIAANADYKIVNVPVNAMDELAILADKHSCGRFVNLTPELKNTPLLSTEQAKKLLKPKAPLMRSFISADYQITQQDAVNKALALIEPLNIQDTLTHLVSYYNRSAAEQNGVDVAHWLKDQYDAMAIRYGREDTDSYFVDTGWYMQPSLVTVLGKDKPGPGIVIGAHMDTLGGRMPGAGDDGSGSSTVMEVARVLMASGFMPQRPVYIIWYAAEERGLVGSEYVVQEFVNNNIPVKAAIQFDMTGFRNEQNDPSMWLFRDYTDKKLTEFSAELIKTYVKVPVKYSHCGYGCSDHASWTEIGVPAAFPCETSFERHNPYIHSSLDTMDLLNLEHMTNFTRLGIAFAIEMAGE